MDDEKKSIILYTEWAQPLKTLSFEDKGRIFDAILSYSETGETPHFDSAAAEMAFSFIRLRLDENAQKWAYIRKKRKEAGSIGGKRRQANQANQANATFAKQNQANQAVNVNVNANVNGNVNAAAKAATEKPPDGGPPLPPSLEQNWISLGLGRRMGPAVQQAMREHLASGLEEGLIVQAMQEAAEHDVKAPLPYIRSILDRCQAQGIHTLTAWQAAHRGGGAKRVDRDTPSGSDFLADAATRPRRHKRKE